MKRFLVACGTAVVVIAGLATHAAPAPATSPADLIHGLVELSQRTCIRPYDLTQIAPGKYDSERVIFKDTGTGATVWRYTHNPGYDHHQYANRPTWSRDGKWLIVDGDRDTHHGYWLMSADGSSLREYDQDFGSWSWTKPHSAFVIDGKNLLEVDIETGERRVLWDGIDPDERGALQLPSEDGKKLLYTSGRGSRSAETSTAYMIDIDGKEPVKSFELHGVVHQIWFIRRPDYSFAFNYEKTNSSFREGQYLCEPAKGGAIRQLNAKQFGHYGLDPDGKYAAFFRKGSLLLFDYDTGKMKPIEPVQHWDHVSWDNDPDIIVYTADYALSIMHVKEDKSEVVCYPQTHFVHGGFETEGHPQMSWDGTKIGFDSSMLGDGDFYTVIARLPDSPTNVQRSGKTLTWAPPARHLEMAGYCVYLDGKPLNREPITATQFDLPSGDGTAEVTAVEPCGIESPRKQAIVPSVPQMTGGKALNSFTTHLTWSASPELDVAYYNVYASTDTVHPTQHDRIASPTATQTTDWGLQAGKSYHYLVTAVNRAGQESGPSNELVVQTPAITVARVEQTVDKVMDDSAVQCDFKVPADGQYAIWVEILPQDPVGKRANARVTAVLDGVKSIWRPNWNLLYPVDSHGENDQKPDTPFWDALKINDSASEIETLKAGSHTLTLSCGESPSQVKRIIVTNDLGAMPPGIWNLIPAHGK